MGRSKKVTLAPLLFFLMIVSISQSPNRFRYFRSRASQAFVMYTCVQAMAVLKIEIASIDCLFTVSEALKRSKNAVSNLA